MIASAKRIRCRRCGHRFDAGVVERGQLVKCPSCTERFRVDGRSFSKHSRVALPVGHIRTVDRGIGQKPRREIKYRNARGGNAWMPYARWWWLTNKGPIPPGQNVYHVDGDTLNDDPSNFALGGLADGPQMKAMDDPKWWANHVKKMRRGTAEHNRLRGSIKRAKSWNPSQWYPVDLAARQIINTPRKNTVPLLRDFGVQLNTPDSIRRRHSIAMGWPGLNRTECCMLACLIEAGEPVRRDVLLDRVNAYRELRGWRPVVKGGMLYANISRLAFVGTVRLTRAYRAVGTIEATRRAIDIRVNPCPVIVVRGSRLGDEPFKHFTKVGADRQPIGRERASGMRLLAEAIAGDTPPGEYELTSNVDRRLAPEGELLLD